VKPTASEQGDVDAPLVLGAAARRRAVDDDLALTQRQVPAIEQAAGEEPAEQPLVAGERREQHERDPALGHRPIEPLLHGRAERRLGWGDPCRHRLAILCVAC